MEEQVQAKDGKQKRIKKDPNAPKKPMSAFFCYQQERREPLKKEMPELDHKSIIRVSKFEFRRGFGVSHLQNKPLKTENQRFL